MWNVARSFMVAAVAAAGFVIAYAPLSAQPPPRCDFISGGGYVITDHDAKANFGSHAGCKNGAFWGYFNYVDHGGALETAPYHVSSLAITGYFEIAPNVRDVCGIAQTNADEPRPSTSAYGWWRRRAWNTRGLWDSSVQRLPREGACRLAMAALAGGTSSSIIPILPARRRIRCPTKTPCVQACRAPTGGSID